MEFIARRDWQKGQSIIKGRSKRGQIVWNGMRGAKNIFLVRLGKDVAEQVVGSKEDARLALERLARGQEAGYVKPKRGRLRFGTLLTEHYLPAKFKSLKPKTCGEYVRTIEREIMLRVIDSHWVNHLTGMENLRTGIGLHAYGQRDPLVAYRAEGQQMFKDLLARMQHDVVHTLFHVTVTEQPVDVRARRAAAQATKASPMAEVAGGRRDAAPVVGAGKIGRNAPCPCGSGKKYKRCCGANV